jgi:uncharacterized coiled-coil protein SlyX
MFLRNYLDFKENNHDPINEKERSAKKERKADQRFLFFQSKEKEQKYLQERDELKERLAVAERKLAEQAQAVAALETQLAGRMAEIDVMQSDLKELDELRDMKEVRRVICLLWLILHFGSEFSLFLREMASERALLRGEPSALFVYVCSFFPSWKQDKRRQQGFEQAYFGEPV